MITVKRNPKADTRTCDVSTVSRQELLDASRTHISEVGAALAYFSGRLIAAAVHHDTDKLTDIDLFYADFRTNFQQTGWWDRHRKIHRHHLAQADGIPDDVDLIDVLEFVADICVSGKARSGEIVVPEIPDSLLRTAFENTVRKLSNSIVVEEVIDTQEMF